MPERPDTTVHNNTTTYVDAIVIYVIMIIWQCPKLVGEPQTIQVMDDHDLILKAMVTRGSPVLGHHHATGPPGLAPGSRVRSAELL
jgi:hypothetical protein